MQKAGNHVVIRAPDAPEYFSGNLLVIDKRPSIDKLLRLESDFARRIGVPPLIGHRSFTWDEPSEGHVDLDAFVECGYDATIFRVWAATPDSIRPVKSHETVNVRSFDNESDWDAWMRMQLDDMPDSSDTVSIRCMAYQRAMYKNLIDRGLGNWWGAFIGDEQVGSLGLFFQGRMGRFQSVITSDAHRNRGICKALVSSVLGETSDRVDRWIMVADGKLARGRNLRATRLHASGTHRQRVQSARLVRAANLD